MPSGRMELPGLYDIDQSLQEDSASFHGAVEVWKNSHSTHVSKNSTNKERATPEVPRYLESNPLGSSLAFCLESEVKGTLIRRLVFSIRPCSHGTQCGPRRRGILSL